MLFSDCLFNLMYIFTTPYWQLSATDFVSERNILRYQTFCA